MQCVRYSHMVEAIGSCTESKSMEPSLNTKPSSLLSSGDRVYPSLTRNGDVNASYWIIYLAMNMAHFSNRDPGGTAKGEQRRNSVPSHGEYSPSRGISKLADDIPDKEYHTVLYAPGIHIHSIQTTTETYFHQLPRYVSPPMGPRRCRP
jgi:hypothetical protein